MHLNVPRLVRSANSHQTHISLPTNEGIWTFPPIPTLHALLLVQSPETDYLCHPPELAFSFLQEIQLQLLFEKSVTVGDFPNGLYLTERLDLNQLWDFLSNTLHLSIVPEPYGFTSEDAQTAPIRAKYHAYETTLHWPVIYRIIVNGFADTETLPYGLLFFESVTRFLSAADTAVRVCIVKAWPLCALFVLAFASI
jgi:hypothetical protein